MEREGKSALTQSYTVYYSVQLVSFERHSQRNLCRLSYVIGRRQSFRRLRLCTRVGMPRWLVPTAYALTQADGLTVSRRLLLLLVRFATIYLSCTHNCSCRRRRRRRERHPFKKEEEEERFRYGRRAERAMAARDMYPTYLPQLPE